jgi:hypothetical protein
MNFNAQIVPATVRLARLCTRVSRLKVDSDFGIFGLYLLAILLLSNGLETYRHTFNHLDEGQHVYALARLEQGQHLYTDFHYLYGPSLLYSLYGPYKLLGGDFGAALITLRVVNPIVSSLFILLSGRLLFTSSACRTWLITVSIFAGTTNYFWCPGFRIWALPLAAAALLPALAKARTWRSFFCGIFAGYALNMSVDITVIGLTALAAGIFHERVLNRTRISATALSAALTGMVATTVLLWCPTILSGGFGKALDGYASLFLSTNWYAGLPLPWPSEAFEGTAAPTYNIFRIYLYFVALAAVSMSYLYQLLRRGNNMHATPAVATAMLVASLLLGRSLLGRFGAYDTIRISFVIPPLLILAALTATQFDSDHTAVRNSIRMTFAIFGAAAFALLSSEPPIRPLFVAVGAAIASDDFSHAIRPAAAEMRYDSTLVRSVLGVEAFDEFVATSDYLRQRNLLNGKVYSFPSSLYNYLLDKPEPTRFDLLDYVAPSRKQRTELVTQLETSRPDVIVFHPLRVFGLSSSNNAELISRELLAFIDQYYIVGATIGPDVIYVRSPTASAPLARKPLQSFSGETLRIFCHGGDCRHGRIMNVSDHVEASIELPEPVLDVDLVEIEVWAHYRTAFASLAKNRFTISGAFVHQELAISIPAEGGPERIRTYLKIPGVIKSFVLTLDHPGPLNPRPETVDLVAVRLYRTGGSRIP